MNKRIIKKVKMDYTDITTSVHENPKTKKTKIRNNNNENNNNQNFNEINQQKRILDLQNEIIKINTEFTFILEENKNFKDNIQQKNNEINNLQNQIENLMFNYNEQATLLNISRDNNENIEHENARLTREIQRINNNVAEATFYGEVPIIPNAIVEVIGNPIIYIDEDEN